MKKANIWIITCVYLLFSAIFAACSSGIGNPITDDVAFVVTHLKHNIPKDYKIPIHYIPKEEGGHCWVELNVYHLEESLKALAQMFGNISTNRENITIIVQMLQGVRFRIGNSDLEVLMADNSNDDNNQSINNNNNRLSSPLKHCCDRRLHRDKLQYITWPGAHVADSTDKPCIIAADSTGCHFVSASVEG
ncbi:hypothetical protein COCON_G00116520 [Conger conger]|uniref:Kit ligand n=1 Tax=Conger conger TaxID=82655 RepID=A0A9Q1DGS7_CONCO|nr:hypothetical protein COCON_G00116520 [Conger conger]